MTRKLAEWASELRQITKIRPSDSSGGETFQRQYNLGMVGADLKVIWEMSINISLVIVEKLGGAIGADLVPWSTAKELEIDCCDRFVSGSVGKSPRMDTSDDSDRSAESATSAYFRDPSVSVLLKFGDVYHANYFHGT